MTRETGTIVTRASGRGSASRTWPTPSRGPSSIRCPRSIRTRHRAALVWLNALAPGVCDRFVQAIRRESRSLHRGHDRPDHARDRAHQRIAEARAARRPAAARSSSAAGCAIGCSAATRRTSTSRSSASPAERLRQLLESFGRVETVGESFQVYKTGDIDVSLPRRESKSGRGHRGFDVTGDPSMSHRGRRAPARLHGQRDRLGSADRRVPRSVRRPRRPRRAGLARRRSRDVRRRQPARAARGAVRRPVRPHARRGDRERSAATSRSTICRPNASGAKSRSCCSRRSRRSASRSPWSSASSPGCFRNCRRSSAVRRNRSGTRRATSGCTPCRSSTRRGSASTTCERPQQMAVMLGARLPRLRQAGSRPRSSTAASARSITKSRASRPRIAFLDRLNVHSMDGYDVRRQVLGARRAAPEAGHRGSRCATRSATARSGGSRRRSTSSCSRGSPRPTAWAASRAASTARAMDWFLERARALGVEHRPPAPILLGRHLLALGLTPVRAWVRF